MKLTGMYFGTIEEVYPSDHPMNASKIQYEYRVLITADDYSQIPVKCIRMDPYGSYHNYEDAVLAKGYRVFVQFPRGDRSMGVITGGSRYCQPATDPKAGIIYEHRFNEVIETNDFNGAWMLRSTSGPFIKLEKTKITVTDTPIQQAGQQNANYTATNNAAAPQGPSFNGQFIILDQVAKTLTINANELAVIVNDSANITIGNNVTVTIGGAATVSVAQDANVTIQGNANVTVTKDVIANINGQLKANVSQNATITSLGTAKVKAPQVQLQSDGAGFPLSSILTMGSDPVVDLITGAPTIGLPTIQAGS